MSIAAQEIFRFAARRNIIVYTVDSTADLSRHGERFKRPCLPTSPGDLPSASR